jgi:hypothetical protein
MSVCYFWKDGEVLIVNKRVSATEARNDFLTDLLCVDTFRETDSPHMRYGIYTFRNGWKPIPFENFPAEFKTHLLLLGVPT